MIDPYDMSRDTRELADRLQHIIFAEGISAAEARFRAAAIIEYNGGIPDDESRESFERLCQVTGISVEEGQQIRARVGDQAADAEDWPSAASEAARNRIKASFTFGFGEDHVFLHGDTPMAAWHAHVINDVLSERFGDLRPDAAGAPAEHTARRHLRLVVLNDGPPRTPPAG